MNLAVPACGVPTARALLPPWAQGLHRSASSIHGGAELPLGTHQTCSTTSAAPGSHLARGNTRGEPENNAPSLHLKQNSKRRTDLCNSRLALRIAGTRSGARLGPAEAKDRLETLHPGCLSETGGWGSGVRDSPTELPSSFKETTWC